LFCCDYKGTSLVQVCVCRHRISKENRNSVEKIIVLMGACHSTEVLEEPYVRRTQMANMYLVKIRHSSIMSDVQTIFFVQSLTLTHLTSLHRWKNVFFLCLLMSTSTSDAWSYDIFNVSSVVEYLVHWPCHTKENYFK